MSNSARVIERGCNDNFLMSCHMTSNNPQGHSPVEIYLDHHATTPVDHRVARVMLEMMTETFGNANSVDHRTGEAASAKVREASSMVGAIVGALDVPVHFTSGASEAIRIGIEIALSRSRVPLRVATSRIEHRAVLDVLEAMARQGRVDLRWIENDDLGLVSLDSIGEALSDGAELVCLMAANNEVGTLQPIQRASEMVRSFGSRMLVDATQAAGKEVIEADEWDLDFVCFSAHKLYGPKGVGALLGRGVSRESIGRVVPHAATPNVPGIAGFAEACALQLNEGAAHESRIADLRDRMQANLLSVVPDLQVNGAQGSRLGNNLHVSAPGAPNEAVVARLRGKVAISTGAACTSGVPGPSHVLQAMRLAPALQESALRMSPGRGTSERDIDQAAQHIVTAIAAVRAEIGERH